MKMKKLNSAVRALSISLSCAAVAATAQTGFAGKAYAEEVEELEKISVTGSRIQRTDIEGAAPVQIITRDEILRSGVTSMGELIQQLPSVAGAATNTQVNNGGEGKAEVSLRGLASTRTLVLLNGRRVVPMGDGADGAVDLNAMPMFMVESVTVLKEGASAIYGSDAIAGVVNIITRTDLDGLELGAFAGQSQEGDGDKFSVDMAWGKQMDNGYIAVNAGMARENEVFAGDREFARFDYGPDDFVKNGVSFQGSSAIPPGRFDGQVTNDAYRLAPPGTPLTLADLRPYVGPDGSSFNDGYNYAPVNYIKTPTERYFGHVFGSFGLGAWGGMGDVNAFAELSYIQRDSDWLLAPEPLFPAFEVDSSGTRSTVDWNNEYNQTGAPIADWRRRLVELDGRNNQFDNTTYRTVVGLEGTLENDWTWDLAFNYGKNESNELQKDALLIDRVNAATGASANGVCLPNALVTVIEPGCIPWNPAQTLTREMLDYATFNKRDSGENTQTMVELNLAGDVLALPAGELGLAGGLAWRKEEGSNTPDANVQAGNTFDNSIKPTAGDYTVNEAYVEVLVPILADMPMVESLDFTAATRYSDYDTFGDTLNSTFKLAWRPTTDLMIRTTFAESFRSPNILELYSGGIDSAEFLTDPSGFDDRDQFTTNIGGSTLLEPETGESFTAGFVWSPEMLQGFSTTVDYYQINVENTISNVGAQFTLDECFANPASVLCNNIIIDGGGAIGTGNILYVRDVQSNLGKLETAGVDVNFRYNNSYDWGTFGINLDTTYTDQYDKIQRDGTVIPHAGLYLETDDGNFTRWRAALTTNVGLGGVNLMHQARYYHSVGEPLELYDDNFDLIEAYIRDIPSVIYHDVRLGYTVPGTETNIAFGVENLMNEQAPLALTGFNANTDDRTYDTIGRFYYIDVKMAFGG